MYCVAQLCGKWLWSISPDTQPLTPYMYVPMEEKFELSQAIIGYVYQHTILWANLL